MPTANVYLGIASPPGSRHLLTATGIGIAAPGKMGTSLPDLLHESLCSVEEQSLPQTPADKTDGLLFLRRTFPGDWKGAEELSLSCCNFSSLPSLPFPNYIISLEPHVFKKSLIHTPSQTLSNNIHASGCVLKGHT